MFRDKGIFIVSIDVELAWGFNLEPLLNDHTAKYLLKLISKSRASIKSLIELLEKHEIPATWGIVGHLLLDQCNKINGVPHSDMPRPNIGIDIDWYALDPCTHVSADPLWYAPDIVNEVLSSSVNHELASHSFSHVDFSGCSRDVALVEVQKSKDLMENLFNITPKSFIFPKTLVGHLDVLNENGFITFRGPKPTPRSKFGADSNISKLTELLKMKIVYPTLVGEPKLEKGLWNIPGSLLFQRSRWISAKDLLKTSIVNVKKAVQSKALFHIILHDYSLTTLDIQKALSKLLATVETLRNKGDIRVMTMKELATHLMNAELLCETSQQR